MRAILIPAAILLVSAVVALETTGRLEPILEPILVFFVGSEEPRLFLVPVDYDPFAPCYGVTDPNDLCV
jgi:hypothetical protein